MHKSGKIDTFFKEGRDMKKLYFLLAISLFLAIPCAADVIIVDANGTGDYATIQAAINAANPHFSQSH